MSAYSPNMWKDELKCNGQCNGTVLLVQNLFGGDIIAYENPTLEKKMHYFNRICNCDIDLTSEQFGNIKLDYFSKVKKVHWNILNQRYFNYYKSYLVLFGKVLYVGLINVHLLHYLYCLFFFRYCRFHSLFSLCFIF